MVPADNLTAPLPSPRQLWPWSENELRLSLEVEPDVESGSAVGQPAGRNKIDPGGGDCGGGSKCYPPRCFGNRAAARHRDSLGEHIQAHIVEQHGISPPSERLLKLFQIVDFDFDFDEMAGGRAGPPQCLRDAPGNRDVIVLDKNGIVEAKAVIGAPARAHGVFFDCAKARRGLSRANNFGLRAPHRGNEGGGCARYAAEAAEKIER